MAFFCPLFLHSSKNILQQYKTYYMSLRIEITRPKTCKDEIINGVIEVDNVQYPITITPTTFFQMKTAGLIHIPVSNKLISNVFDVTDDLPF